MAVTIDSGPIEATELLRHVPENKWRELMLARRDFMAIKLSYDCRCLVTFVNDAKLMFRVLGFSSVEHMIREGYGLEPAEIQLAVDWLKLNPPDEPMPLDGVVARALRAQEIDAEDRANQRPAHVHIDRDVDNNTGDIHVRPTGTSAAAALRRLRKDRPDIHARVLAGELSAHAGMVEADFRKPAKSRRKPAVERIRRMIAKHGDELTADDVRSLKEQLDALA